MKKLVLGPCASGKTTACITHVLTHRQQQLLAPIYVLVPTALHAHHFRQRLKSQGNALGVSVMMLHAFQFKLLEKSGNFSQATQPILLRDLLQKVIEELSNASKLTTYTSIANMPGFVQAMQQRIQLLKDYCISPDTFAAAANTTAISGGSDVAKIYAAYLEAQQTLYMPDWDMQSENALALIRQNPALLGKQPLIVIDGYADFLPSELAYVQALCDLPNVDLLLTLPFRGDDPIYDYLISTLESLPTNIDRVILPKQQQSFAQQLAQQVMAMDTVMDPTPVVTLLTAQTPSEEAREAVRWSKAASLRDGIPLEKQVIIVPRQGNYLQLLRAHAAEFNVPIFYSSGEPLVSTPQIASLLDLLELPENDYASGKVLEIVRTPFLDLSSICGLEKQHFHPLQAIVWYSNLVGNYRNWDAALERLIQRTKHQITEDEELETRKVPAPAEAQVLRDGLAKLHRRLDQRDKQPFTNWIQWLETLLSEARFWPALTNTELEIAPAYTGLLKVLRELSLRETTNKDVTLGYAAFVDILKTHIQMQMVVPTTFKRNALSVLHPDQVNGLRYEAVAVLGLAEGVFPKPDRADPFFAEDLRESLGLPLMLDTHQATQFTNVISRFDRKLLISRPTIANDGEAWPASPYWDAVTKTLSKNEVEVINQQQQRSLADAASGSELLHWAAQYGLQLPPEAVKNWQAQNLTLEELGKTLAARQAKAATGSHEGDLTSQAQVFAEIFGDTYLWSLSKLERWAQCPHFFYTTTVLGLSRMEPPRIGADYSQIGTVQHTILEKAYSTAVRKQTHVLDVLTEITHSELEIAPEVLGFQADETWHIHKQEITDRLRKTVEVLNEKVDPNWNPFAFELQFGTEETTPVTLTDGDRTIKIRGVIDRVDRNSQGHLRVIDYKSGDIPTRADLDSGKKLQLPVYALVLSQVLTEEDAEADIIGGLYWSIKQARNIKLSSKEPDATEAKNQAKAVAFDYVRNAQAADFPPMPPEGGCPSYCPALEWCWRYTEKTF